MKRTEYWTLSLLALLAWGALAFGGVYTWGYIPLICGAAVLGIAGITDRGEKSRKVARALALGLGAAGIAAALQLVPLTGATLQQVAPETHAFLRATDFAFAAGLTPRHALSISPESTARGLLFIAGFALLFLGAMRMMSGGSLKVFCVGLIALSTLLALVGIIQKPLYAGRIYGLWAPEYDGAVFGPFVNRNHFAGWMIMALSLALGYFCGRIATIAGTAPGALRERVLWLSSPEANQILLLAISLAVMALSLVLTLSRSGISCFALAVAITGAIALARPGGGPGRRGFIASYLFFLLVVAIGWAGSEAVAQRFASADWSEFNNRLGAWRDAWNIAMRFMPLGSGLNTYGATTRVLQTYDLEHYYGEAHNDYLQFLAEGGLLVGIPALVTLLAFAWLVWKRFHNTGDDPLTWWIRAGAVTGLIAIGLQEVVDFSLQMPGNALLFAILSAVAIHEPAPVKRRHLSHARRELSVAV